MKSHPYRTPCPGDHINIEMILYFFYLFLFLPRCLFSPEFENRSSFFLSLLSGCLFLCLQLRSETLQLIKHICLSFFIFFCLLFVSRLLDASEVTTPSEPHVLVIMSISGCLFFYVFYLVFYVVIIPLSFSSFFSHYFHFFWDILLDASYKVTTQSEPHVLTIMSILGC